MKEKYITPEMQAIVVSCDDVITTSGENETPFVPFSETWTDDVPSITQ